MINETTLLSGPKFRELVGAARSTIWKAQQQGIIGGLRIGNQTVFTLSDVAAFKARRKHVRNERETSNGTTATRMLRAQELTACALAMQTLAGLGNEFRVRTFDFAERLESEVAKILMTSQTGAPTLSIDSTPAEHAPTLSIDSTPAEHAPPPRLLPRRQRKRDENPLT